MARARRGQPAVGLPLRETLEALAHRYHHLRNEHKRAAPESSDRRRGEDEMLELRDRFERVLDEWVPQEELREAWLDHLRNRTPAPRLPEAILPVVFRGRSEAGSTAEVRRGPDGLDVEVDGTLVERVVADKDLSVRTPPARLRFDGFVFGETFAVSEEALGGLAAFLDEGSAPPWDLAPELLSDGLIDIHFELTPRGARALALAGAGQPLL
jgi:hypothetical protein